MDKKTAVSRELAFVFFISILFIDWLYIFSAHQQETIISHWGIALPMILPLFFALAMLSLIGMFLSSVWGYFLAYVALLFSMFFSGISYTLLTVPQIVNDLQLIFLILLNLIVFFYLIFCHISLVSNK